MAASNSELEFALNTAFVMLCSAMIFLMQAGFAFLEAGSVRAKNTSSILLKNIVDAAIGVIMFFVCGYAFAYGDKSNLFLGYEYFFLAHLPDKRYVDFFFQFVFANTSVTIISGALAERTNIWAYVGFSCLMLGFIYPVAAHWVFTDEGWLAELHFVDYAGSAVIHGLGGAGAFVGALLVGPRLGRFEGSEVLAIPGHSTVLATLGFMILWFGFFAFNGGAEGGIVGDGFDANVVGRAVTNTAISCGAALLSTMIILKVSLVKQEVHVFGRELMLWNALGGFWSLGGAINGGLAGCVAICASANVVEPWAAMVIGSVSGAVYAASSKSLLLLHIDDPLNASPVHLGSGIWGTLAFALFCPPDRTSQIPDGGILYAWNGDAFIQFGIQCLGVVAIAGWAVLWTTVVFGILRLCGVLRVSAIAEEDGLDYDDGEPAYPLDPALAGTKSSFLESDTLSQSELPSTSAF